MLAIMYMKTQRVTGNRGNSRKLHVVDDKGLVVPWRVGRRKNGELNSKDRAIILLKTHVEKMSLLGSAIISMKINNLIKAAGRNRERACAEECYGFCPLDRFSRALEGEVGATRRSSGTGRRTPRVATEGKWHAGKAPAP